MPTGDGVVMRKKTSFGWKSAGYALIVSAWASFMPFSAPGQFRAGPVSSSTKQDHVRFNLDSQYRTLISDFHSSLELYPYSRIDRLPKRFRTIPTVSSFGQKLKHQRKVESCHSGVSGLHRNHAHVQHLDRARDPRCPKAPV
jgi:hypothetical protein